jgi:hypothetical protein
MRGIRISSGRCRRPEQAILILRLRSSASCLGTTGASCPPSTPPPLHPIHPSLFHSKWLGPGGSDAHGYSVFANVIGGKHVVEAIVAQGNVKAQGGLNYLQPAVPILSIDA